MKAKKVFQKRINGMKPLPHIMRDVARPLLNKFGFVEAALITDWVQIVGPEYAPYLVPEKVTFKANSRTNGVLKLQVASGMALMMQHQEPYLLERINQYFGYPAISRLLLTQVRQKITPPKVSPQLNKGIQQTLYENLSAFEEDNDLAKALRSLADALSYSSLFYVMTLSSPVLGTLKYLVVRSGSSFGLS